MMKKIEAVIRPEKLDSVHLALAESGYPGITIIEAEGHGRQRGSLRQWRGEQYKIDFLPKIKIEIICKDQDLKKLLQVLQDAAFTGEVGDGKIFVYDVAEVVRIRTQERGEAALV